MILELIDEAVEKGARQWKAAELIGLSYRTLERWRKPGQEGDRRRGPNTPPANKLSPEERQEVIEIVNSPEFRDLSPNQIVPILAEGDEYIASESTMFRILRDEELLQHRGKSRAPVSRRAPDEHVATGPNQVWSWDISYLRAPVRGEFWYLYMVVDIWSRKIVGWAVHESESSEHAAALIAAAYQHEGVKPGSLSLHMDNGSPMKGATLVATLRALGVLPSYSRPSVSNDNPFSEALFRTTKYRPEFPSDPFATLEEARRWVAAFVDWYNTQHRHSAIRFVTPADRHSGRDVELLERRSRTYRAARNRHPERWRGKTRNWDPIEEVKLNPKTSAAPQTS